MLALSLKNKLSILSANELDLFMKNELLQPL